LKKSLKIAIIAAPYILAAIYGLLLLTSHFWEKSHEDAVVPLLVNRGNRFEMHYDNTSLGKHFLWVNGHPVVRTSPGENEPADEFIKEFIIGDSPDGEPYRFIASCLINDETVIYKTSGMERFEILGYMRLNEVQLNCKDVLEDMRNVIRHEYPVHAILDSEPGTGSSEPKGAFGIYEGLGYRIEALTNGVETEWQFYVKVYDGSDYIRAEKIFSMRWQL
jgi:hypothetical protein